MKHLKYFVTHSQYETYMNSNDKILPNVSFCADTKDKHFTKTNDVVAKFNIQQQLTIYVDDFPQIVCDEEYNGDMEAFKQDFIENLLSYGTNEYIYTGETFYYEDDDTDYYLWYCDYASDASYMLTNTLDFTGKSLEDDIDNDYCPFVYLLDEDKEVTYTNEDEPASEYILVAARDGLETKILNNTALVEKIVVDGVVQPSVVSSYNFETFGEHTVKYTLADPTNIGNSAFYNCSSLTSLTIPNSVTSIGNNAFYGCRGLTSVTIPNSVTTIGEGAFYQCTGLTSVTIGNSVTTIGSNAFSSCTSLTSVTLNSNSIVSKNYTTSSNIKSIFGSQVTEYIIGDSVTSIGDYAFYQCTGLTNVTIGNSVTTIGRSAFNHCIGLTSITIPNSVTTIGDYAFRNCSNLTSITIPNSVTSIGQYAFSNCTGLTSVTIGNSVTEIGTSAFDNSNATVIINSNSLVSTNYQVHSGLTDNIKGSHYILGDNITSIGSNAFNYIVISSIGGIGSGASVEISDSVTSIAENAFNTCTSLITVNLGKNISSLYSQSFKNCDEIEILSVDIANTTYDSRNNCNAIIETATNTLIVGCQNTVIPNSVTSIGESAFYYCSSLTSITIPNSVTSIGESAFRGCRGLTSVTIPNSVTTIGEYAFKDCNNLPIINFIRYADTYVVKVTNTSKSTYAIKDGTRFIGEEAFSGCSAITSVGDVGSSVEFPNSLEYIGRYAFKDCTSLASVTISNTIDTIINSAFTGCTSLETVTINNPDIISKTYNETSNYTTRYGTQVTKYILCEGATTIGDFAFYAGTGLTSIGGLGSGASVEIPSTVTSIGQQVFRSCTGLTTVTIPEGVTTIGAYAFHVCRNLTTVNISSTVTTIGSYVFYGCNKLETITSLRTTRPSIQSNTFREVKSGGTLYVPTGSDYATWMQTGNYYLGKYSWTKVEQ